MDIKEYIIEDDVLGVYAISLVSAPAIESNFIQLSKELNLKVIDDERGVLMGAALIPDLPILRNGDEGEYHIFFSKDTVRKTSELFLKNSFQHETTLEHQHKLNSNLVVESWIKEDETHDKSVKFGIDAPVGSWIVTMKVEDPDILELARQGKIKGFSIEGQFEDKSELSKDPKELVDEINKLINQF